MLIDDAGSAGIVRETGQFFNDRVTGMHEFKHDIRNKHDIGNKHDIENKPMKSSKDRALEQVEDSSPDCGDIAVETMVRCKTAMTLSLSTSPTNRCVL